MSNRLVAGSIPVLEKDFWVAQLVEQSADLTVKFKAQSSRLKNQGSKVNSFKDQVLKT